jgi:hypothetical protein
LQGEKKKKISKLSKQQAGFFHTLSSPLRLSSASNNNLHARVEDKKLFMAYGTRERGRMHLE